VSQSDYLYSIYATYTTSNGVDDLSPPLPDPMTWEVAPTATTSTTISMTATTAYDPSGWEYYFEETSGNPGGDDSGWQDGPTYTDTGLTPGTMYAYTCKTRDKSINQNTSAASSEQSATTPVSGPAGTVGIEQPYPYISTLANRRAMPFTQPEDGTIESISMYHEGGSGQVILAVYDGEAAPGNRLATTAATAVNSSAGWQTIALIDPVWIPAGNRIWLAWVFETNPGIRYKQVVGSQGRAQSSATWSGGMPATFGTVSQSDYLYSIYATYTTSNEILFSDLFTNALGPSWTVVDDTGNGENWSVVSGWLLQSEFLETDALDLSTSYHIGTYAALDNPPVSPFPSDYRFSVDITPLPNPADPSEGNDVGIMFRYQGPDDYYRVSMSAKFGFTRFEKRVAGSFQTLAVNAIGYVDNQPMTMTAEVNGDTIVVWIDGDPVFAVVDSDIPSGTVALYCQDRAQFDNVLITAPPEQPVVAISSPLAYSVTPGNLVDLNVSAVALNVPVGGRVVFTLDGGSETEATTVSGNLYSAQFPGVPNGEHTVAAIIKDVADDDVDDDVNLTVGTGGDYYVTLGNSITNGVGDFNPLNNDSDDGRIVSIQGYQAQLADGLTTAASPQIVFNEGIEGDQAWELDGRLFSILERHPGANKFLVMIGTNDSATGIETPANVFRADVAAIAGTIEGLGMGVWLAEILPTNGNAARNALIEQYNTEIRGIANASGDKIFLGPDFNTVFTDRPDLYTDLLHPNDAGYGVMADEWQGVLP
ncbi:MAG: hypothetical protein KQI81_15680, partial [Deltaproteobacteria bacterium]|nr:hypothetical protein [Deltaproteobacteria bacterium]